MGKWSKPLAKVAVLGIVLGVSTVGVPGSVAMAEKAAPPSTVVVYDQTTSVASGAIVFTPLIDVSTFRQIRVVVQPSIGGSCLVFVFPVDEAGNAVGALDWAPQSFNLADPCWLNKAYDTPGVAIKVQMNNYFQTANDIRVAIYGQPY